MPLTSDLWERAQFLMRHSSNYFFLPYSCYVPAQKKGVSQTQRSRLHLHSCLLFFTYIFSTRRFNEANMVSGAPPPC